MLPVPGFTSAYCRPEDDVLKSKLGTVFCAAFAQPTCVVVASIRGAISMARRRLMPVDLSPPSDPDLIRVGIRLVCLSSGVWKDAHPETTRQMKRTDSAVVVDMILAGSSQHKLCK